MSHVTVYLLFTIPFALLLGSFISKRYCEGSIKVFKYIFYGFTIFSYIFLVMNTTLLNNLFDASISPLINFVIPLLLLALGAGIFVGIIILINPIHGWNLLEKNKTLSHFIIYGFVLLCLISSFVSILTTFLKK